MFRRKFIARAAALLAGVTFPAISSFAHTPYAQWDIFRKRNLQVLTSHADLPADEVGDEWVALLREKLPLSRALVSRAHDMPRIAALLKTNQSKLAVLSYMHARLMFTKYHTSIRNLMDARLVKMDYRLRGVLERHRRIYFGNWRK
jgi:hypothetical protein